MAARQIIVPGAMPSRDANGRAIPGRLRFYEPGTAYTTPATVYADVGLTVAHAFPLLSDAAGRWPQIWADESETFDVAWTDQVYDRPLGGPWTDLAPANDAVLASVLLAESAAATAQAAAAAAAAAATGLNTVGTSASTRTIGVGERVFAMDQPGLGYASGQRVVAAIIGAGQNSMSGVVTAWSEPNLTVQMDDTEGAGSASAWIISQVPRDGVQSVAGLFGPGISRADLRLALGVDGPETGDLASGAIFGLETSRNATAPTTSIDIAVGQRRSSDNTTDIVLASPLTVNLSTTGLLGRDVATTLATGQSWHIHLICRTDTMEVSAVASLSPTAPSFSLVSPYAKSAYVFSLPRLGADTWPASGTNIPPYVQVGDDVELGLPTNEWTGQTGSASPLLRDFHVPLGMKVKVWLYAQLNFTSGALLVFKDPDNGVPTAFGGTDQRADIRLPGSDYRTDNVQIWTSTAGQVYVHCSQAGATWGAKTYGWTIPRGRM